MFIHLLESSDQETFCAAAGCLMDADDVLHDLEAQLKASIARELDQREFPVSDLSWEEILARMKRVDQETSRRVLLLELAGVACADLDVHPTEVRLLEQAAHALRLEPADVSRSLSFAERAQALHADGRSLIESSTSGTSRD
jgi:uncharacterized tellurite resistance protein B-like protein